MSPLLPSGCGIERLVKSSPTGLVVCRRPLRGWGVPNWLSAPRGGRGVCRTSPAGIPALESCEPRSGEKLERSGGEGRKNLKPDPPPWSAEPPRSVSAVSRPSVDAPCAAPPGLRVCRPSLPRPARRRPCGSRGCRGGPGLHPAQVAPPQARGAATPCPAELGSPRGRQLAGTPGCCCCCSSTRR